MDYPVRTAAQLRQHIRGLRKAKGLTQAHLAQVLGTTQSRIAQIEADPAAVSFEQLFDVLSALGADVLLRDRSATAPGRVGPAARKATTATGRARDEW